MHNNKVIHKINAVLLSIFPLFIVLIAELNQMHSIRKLINFVFQRPEVIVFDTLIVGIIFIVFLFFVKHGYVAAGIIGISLYILSCIEYFKYKSSGSHFVFGDLLMSGNASDLAQFADIRISFYLVFNLLSIIWFCSLLFLTKAKITWRLKNRIIAGISISACVSFIFFSPSISFPILNSFAIETDPALNVYEANETFEDENMLAYLVQDTAIKISNSIETPQDYSQQLIDNTVQELQPIHSDDDNDFQSPDIIYILSESFGDYRKILTDSSPLDSYYENFDAISEEGYIGNCVVPTFGGYTTRCEFELLMGLPVKALSNAELPHTLLQERDQASIANYYNSLDYMTTYIHPFSSTFYNRDEVYPQYGFDSLLFRTDLTVNTEYYRNYVSDDTVFKQIEQILIQSDTPNYIFATTMQNHQPYACPESGLSEFGYYMQGIGETDAALADFVSFLKEYDRPVILVFLGDHYPFLNEEGNPYESAGIKAGNVESLYQKEYLLWANRDLDYSIIPKDISLFYLPNVVRQLINAPQTATTQLMDEQLQLCPLFSDNVAESPDTNEKLELLTYDVVFGKLYFKNYSAD